MSPYLPVGLPAPAPRRDGLDTPYWAALAEERIVIQRCGSCRCWQWGPEWLCHHCSSFEMGWEAVPPTGRLFSWTRTWHPSHPSLGDRGAYLIALVELPRAGGVRLIGNLLGDAQQSVAIGMSVWAVFEHHRTATPPFTLLQWVAD